MILYCLTFQSNVFPITTISLDFVEAVRTRFQFSKSDVSNEKYGLSDDWAFPYCNSGSGFHETG